MITNVIVLTAAMMVWRVESGGVTNPPAGDSGRAVGAYQMWPCAVAEANRIARQRYGRAPWVLADRENYFMARSMCLVTLQWHYDRGVTDVVDLAARWRNPKGDAPAWHRRKLVRELAAMKGE